MRPWVTFPNVMGNGDLQHGGGQLGFESYVLAILVPARTHIVKRGTRQAA